jgi:hypothetical protein
MKGYYTVQLHAPELASSARIALETRYVGCVEAELGGHEASGRGRQDAEREPGVDLARERGGHADGRKFHGHGAAGSPQERRAGGG